MSKKPLNMQYILGFMVFHCSFPMAEGMKAYFQQPWILQLHGKLFPSSEIPV
jgi:hypothetical protein